MPESLLLNQSTVDQIFQKLDVNHIDFKRLLESEVQDMLVQRCVKRKVSEDYVLDLEEYSTIDDYYSSFGAKTRQHLRQYRRKFDKYLDETGSEFKCGILDCENRPDKQDFRRIGQHIYELNDMRCKAKGFNSTAKNEWIDIALKCGTMLYYQIDGAIIAGTILTVVDGQAFLHTIAHDPRFNKYNIGNLILKDTIDYMWEHGVKTIHFLWGYADYKIRFLAKEKCLYDVSVYRNDFLYFIGSAKARVSDYARLIKHKLKPIYNKLFNE